LNTAEGKAAAELFRRGVFTGTADGKFHGEMTLNRAQAVKILTSFCFQGQPTGILPAQFPDVEASAWYHDYVALALQNGLVHGYPDGLFHPEQEVNTVEFLKILTLSLKLSQNLPFSYSDVDASAWYMPYVGVAVKYNLFPNRSAHLYPDWPLTRNEVAVALYNYLQNSVPEEPVPPV